MLDILIDLHKTCEIHPICYIIISCPMLLQRKIGEQVYLGPYLIVGKIQEGTQSIILLGRNKEKFYGLKVYKNGDAGIKFFQKQMEILCYLDHQLVVKPLESFAPELAAVDHQQKIVVEPFLVMQYYQNGDLRNFMSLGAIPFRIRNHLIRSMAKCLLALEMYGIIHADIKPENFLVDENYNLKIIDFGVAMRAGQQKLQLVGTTHYIAPQIYKSKNYSYKSDLFAFGVICFELVSGKKLTLPFKQAKICDCNFLLLKQKMYDRFWSKFPSTELQPQIKQYIQKILSPNPQQRPSAAQILEMECFKQIATSDECNTFFQTSKPNLKIQPCFNCITF